MRNHLKLNLNREDSANLYIRTVSMKINCVLNFALQNTSKLNTTYNQKGK